MAKFSDKCFCIYALTENATILTAQDTSKIEPSVVNAKSGCQPAAKTSSPRKCIRIRHSNDELSEYLAWSTTFGYARRKVWSSRARERRLTGAEEDQQELQTLFVANEVEQAQQEEEKVQPRHNAGNGFIRPVRTRKHFVDPIIGDGRDGRAIGYTRARHGCLSEFRDTCTTTGRRWGRNERETEPWV